MADLVDVEMFWGNTDWTGKVSEVSAKLTGEIHNAGCLVVGSRHNFTATPSASEMVSPLKNQQSAGADIPKAAVMPNSKADVLAVLDGACWYDEQSCL